MLESVLDVFTGVGTWIGQAVNDMIPMFWTAPSGSTPGSLTFLGVLAVAGLAFSVVFLIVGLISSFLRFRG